MMLRKTPLPRKRATPRREGPKSPRIKPGRVEDPEHLARVRSLPCVVCQSPPPVEAHHPRSGRGMGQKAGDDQAIALCAACHRTGKHAFHAGPRMFQSLYGSEGLLLARTLERLKEQE